MITFTAEQYVYDVLSGRITACKWIKRACRRYLYDLATAEERGLWFDVAAARRAIAFFLILRHWKGEWAGQPIILEPWQQFVVWNLFGWKWKATGLRRFRTLYAEVGRKQGKTTMAAGIGLYLMIADDEPGAEIYTSAVKRDQARIAHKDATEMVKRSPLLKKHINIVRDNLHSLENSSKFEPLGRDANSTDGLNPHGIIADELHAWKDASLWGVLETATGARSQPMMLAITTAGFNPDSYCMEQRHHAERVLDGVVDDDAYFAVIYTLDDEDMKDVAGGNGDGASLPWWEDESLWIKANPSLGVTKKRSYMRRQAQRATQIASNWVHFVTKELSVWTQGEVKWVNIAHWDACGRYPVDEAELIGRRCYGGLDLSSTTDITAWVLVFPPAAPDEPYIVLPRFFVPEDNVYDRTHKDQVPYERWIEDGHIFATPGNMVDDDFIIGQVAEDAETFDLQEVAYDRWGSARIVVALQNEAGVTVDEKVAEMYNQPLLVQFGQGFASMSGPMKELEKLILGHRLAHGGNPVLTWMAHNTVAKMDAAENVKPDKAKSTERIDGIVATIMGLARAMVDDKPGKRQRSVYEDRGLRTI